MITILNNSIQRFDLNLIMYFARLNGFETLQKLFFGLSRAGDGQLYVLWGISNLILNGDMGQMYFFAGILAFAIELPVYFLIKRNIKRPRPSEIYLINFC